MSTPVVSYAELRNLDPADRQDVNVWIAETFDWAVVSIRLFGEGAVELMCVAGAKRSDVVDGCLHTFTAYEDGCARGVLTTRRVVNVSAMPPPLLRLLVGVA